MLGALQAMYSLLATSAIMGLLSVAFGMSNRSGAPARQKDVALGIVFGLTAVLAMIEPIRIAPGVIVDLRSIPIVFAAGYLRAPAAGTALGLAAVGRLAIGGSGTFAGLLGLFLALAGGLGWRRWLQRGFGNRAHRLPLLALASCAGFLGGLALPTSLLKAFLSSVAVVAPIQFASVLFVGYLFERERANKEAEDRLARAADHDPLTGVLNRRGFESAAIASTPHYAGAALLLLDLDFFKSVNDRFGHPCGDAVLRAIRARLAPHLRPGDLLGRLGGEEFAIYLPQVAPASAERVAERLCKAVRSIPFEVPSASPVTVTVSIGVAWSEGSRGSAELLMATADVALYSAKQQGRDRHVMIDARDLDHGVLLDGTAAA